MNNEKLQWHPAFAAALRITLQDEMKYLELQEEYLLSKKPPQIDVLILKKVKEISLKKKIGQIFRGHNIIEYKSPDDTLSINDFYKVYGYTCFYQSNTDKIKEIDPTDLTITFAGSHYPRELFKHIKETRGIEVQQQSDGIYYLQGDVIPIQFLYIPKLDKEENYWLQTLRNNLAAGEEIRTLMANYEKNRKLKDYSAVMNLVTRANWTQMEVEKKMCDALNELFAEELKEADARGRKEGHKSGVIEGRRTGMIEGHRTGVIEGRKSGRADGIKLTKKVFQLSAQGESMESIAEKCNIPLEEVRDILE